MSGHHVSEAHINGHHVRDIMWVYLMSEDYMLYDIMLVDIMLEVSC